MNEEQTYWTKPNTLETQLPCETSTQSCDVIKFARQYAREKPGVVALWCLGVVALLSFLLSPVCDWLERWRLGRIPAVLMTAILGFSLLGIVIWTAAVQITSLAGEMVGLVDQCAAADLVCISATPPAAVMHARYLSKRLRDRLPQANLVVGVWGAQGDLNKSRERIGCDAIVVATLKAVEDQVGTPIQPSVPQPHTQTSTQHGPRAMSGTPQ